MARKNNVVANNLETRGNIRKWHKAKCKDRNERYSYGLKFCRFSGVMVTFENYTVMNAMLYFKLTVNPKENQQINIRVSFTTSILSKFTIMPEVTEL